MPAGNTGRAAAHAARTKIERPYPEEPTPAMLASLYPIALSAMLFLVPGLAKPLWGLLICLLSTKIVVRRADQVSALDAHLERHGYCTARAPSGAPAEGLHFATAKGYMIAQKLREPSDRGTHRTSYVIYVFTAAAVHAYGRVLTSAAPQRVTFISPLNAWNAKVCSYDLEPLGAPRPWQAAACDEILSQFRTARCSSCLVTGSPGTGKSALGEFVAERCRSKGDDAKLIYGFDLTSAGLAIDDYIKDASADSPVIMVLDEIDTAIDYATDTTRNNKGSVTAHAENITRLHVLLDRLNRHRGLILIATTNRTLAEFKESSPAFIREGRFALKIEAPNSMA